MGVEAKIQALSELGAYITANDERLQAHVHRASVENPWFTKENIELALTSIATQFLNKELLTVWVNGKFQEPADPMKQVGIVMAGNIPAVAFHDLLCVFVSGNIAQIKLSDKDKYLIPFLIKKLTEINPEFDSYFHYIDRLSGYDAVIATGSNNSATYFEYYFRHVPHIIRKNRNAVAVLNGKESRDQLDALGKDIFQFFGLGCRSVSHLFVPRGYQFEQLEISLNKFDNIAQHNKYRNNLDYNLAIAILNRSNHRNLPHVVLTEHDQLISPVSCLYYSFYDDTSELNETLAQYSEDIQCVVGGVSLADYTPIPFGTAQQPALKDYADGINTLAFLENIHKFSHIIT